MLKVTDIAKFQTTQKAVPTACTDPAFYLIFQRLSTANDEIVEVLLSKHQVLAALRFIRGIGGHDNISARKFLDAAKQTEDHMLFYTIFRFFEQRNQRLRGNPSFTPGENATARKRRGVATLSTRRSLAAGVG